MQYEQVVIAGNYATRLGGVRSVEEFIVFRRLSFLSERPLRRPWSPITAKAALNSVTDSLRTLRFDRRATSIATRVRTTQLAEAEARDMRCLPVPALLNQGRTNIR